MRVQVALVFAILGVVAGAVRAEDPVHFQDARLKAAVEEALWVSDPTPSDMLGLTELIYPNTGTYLNGIQNLTGLEHAVNLQTLNLRYHQVGNVSPLSELKNLTTLIFYGNRRISDIGPLSNLVALKKLDLTRNEIENTSSISGLVNLTWLSLHRNRVSDISALSTLTQLSHLDLRINPLNQDAYDTYLDQIRENNPGLWFFGYDPFFHRRLLLDSTIGGSVAVPGEGAFSYEYNEELWLIAEAEPNFVFAGYSGTYTSRQNPMRFTVDQDHEIWANFQSTFDTIHVDDDAPADPGPGQAGTSDPREDGSAAHPFDSIQEAIDVAARGASVLVRPGTYAERIRFRGRNIRLTGIDQNDPNETPYPVLEGGGKGPVVTFATRERPDCVMTGFVITGGQDSQAGAILCSQSSPTITHCLIVGNRATDPNAAAIRCIDGDPTFVNCTIADNQGAGFGVVDSNMVVVNSIVWGNATTAISTSGAGTPQVSYSDVSGGWPGPGNLDADPLFARRGHWVDPDSPGAIWMMGDYHLQSQAGRWDPITRSWVQDDATSPCIDGGDPLDAIENEPLPNGSVRNMGAYGGGAQASQSD